MIGVVVVVMGQTNNTIQQFGPEFVVIPVRDGLTGIFTAYANSIFEWCEIRNINADFIARWTDEKGAFSMWRVDDPGQRLLFILQWTV